MIIPEKVKVGELPRAADMNALIDAVRELQGRVGIVPDEGNDNTESLHAFWGDIEAADVPGKAKVIFEWAYVRCEAGGVVWDVFDDDASRVFTVTDGDRFYLKVDTNVHGKITAVALMQYAEAADDPEETAHEPPFTTSGTAGEYYLKVAEFSKVDGSWDVVCYCKNDLHWQPFGGVHIGDGAELVDSWNETRGQLLVRTLAGVEAATDPGVSVEVTGGNTVLVSAEPTGASGVLEWVGLCDGNLFSKVGITVENGMVKQIDTAEIEVGECNEDGGEEPTPTVIP